jgi:hypothetical protein
MTTGTGRISERLRKAYTNYFYKFSWEKDLDVIPLDYRVEFVELKKILSDDLGQTISSERKELKRKNPEITDDLLGQISNASTVIKNLHWRTAQRAAKLISHVRGYICSCFSYLHTYKLMNINIIAFISAKEK